MGFTPSNGAELQTEFFIPRAQAVQAIMAVETLHKEVSPALFVTEIRSIAADGLWMSPAYGRDVVAVHFTWKPESEKVMAVIPKVQQVLEPFGPVPHWGKISTLNSSYLAARYERFGDFIKLVKKHDPDGRFRNDYMAEKLGV